MALAKQDTTASSNQSTSNQATPNDIGIGGVVQKYTWTWEGRPLSIIYETLGEGTPVLLLPAFRAYPKNPLRRKLT
jgi:hypothetical protein